MARCKMAAQARSSFSSNYVPQRSRSVEHNVPSSTTVTHEGTINENFYKLKQKETKLISNFEVSYASIKNPITEKREYFLGLLGKSKYDGVGLREPIDIGIALDISGSMSCNINEKSESRLEIAKKSLITFINNLSENDNISITAFDHECLNIVSFANAKKFLADKKNIDKINKLNPNGGTDIYKGLKEVYDNMMNTKNNINKQRRIILITDMDYSEDSNFIDLCKNMPKNNIFLTILGISESFNTELTELISKEKGCNYYIISNDTDMKKYLIDEFNYICFPLSFNEKLEILSPFLKVKSVIGTGFKRLEENKENVEWNLDTHKLFDKEYKDNIFFLLLYFKRKGKVLPKPVILCISQFLKTFHRKTISEINTTFPSTLTKYRKDYYVKGGMLLIKLDENSVKEDNICQFTLSGEDTNHQKYVKDEILSFQKKKDDYFSDQNIEVSLALYYFTKFNRKIMKICNDEYKNKKNKNNSLDFIASDKFSGIKTEIINLLRNHYYKKTVNDNLDKYLTNMDNICKEAEDYAKKKTKKSKEKKKEIELDENKEEKKTNTKKKVPKKKKPAAKKKLLGNKRKRAK